jgi:hypothetical protein
MLMRSASTNGPNVLCESYQGQLTDIYGPQIAAALATGWQEAPLLHQPGESLLYVRLGQGQDDAVHDRPVLYVPGFTEGITAKAPFAAEMASRGFDIVLPDQNRRSIMRDTLDKRNATYTQALNYLGVIEAERLTGTTVDVITHSYGSLIFQAMLKIAQSRNQPTFEGTNLVELAPAGSNKHENLFKIGGRLLWQNIYEARTAKDFHDPDGVMFKAGVKNFFANVPRTSLEAWELSRRQVDYRYLAMSGLKSITVLAYAKDRLFSHRVLESAMEEALEYGVAYAMPYSLAERNGVLRGGTDASHNDEQFNPERVADSVEQILIAA